MSPENFQHVAGSLQKNTRAHSAQARYGPLCAGFTFSDSDDSSCPMNSIQIKTESACKSAAAAVGKNYIRSETTNNYPTGCYVHNTDRVFFNMATAGTSRADSRLLCAVLIGVPSSPH